MFTLWACVEEWYDEKLMQFWSINKRFALKLGFLLKLLKGG